MEYIIGGIALVMVLFLAGFFMKRKYFGVVDKYESWKIDIMNRPVLEEMAKVKQLNMTGQTEELFERWRQEWDELVTAKLPGIEDYLFDAEEYIDKYRFGKAKESLAVIEQKLTETEDKIKQILYELNELVGSEEKNRDEIDGLKDLYRECKRNLLAHRHSFGNAEATLEALLEEISSGFHEFDKMTENGDYLKARETVLALNEMLAQLSFKMEWIPSLLHDCQTVIPGHITMLRDGFREMASQGYLLNHLKIEEEIEGFEKANNHCLSLLENGEVAETENQIKDLKERVETIFDLLEKEVHSKQYIKNSEPVAKELLIKAIAESKTIKAETEQIQASYHLSEKELEAQVEADNMLKGLIKRFELIDHRITENDTAQSALKEDLDEAIQQLNELVENQTLLKSKLHALRKDEMAARESVKQLSKKVSEMIRTISKSNLPGVAKDYKYLLDDANESLSQVNEKLEKSPLDIPEVQQYLEIAAMTVQKLEASTEDLLETVLLAEKVIQYGNRYRSRYASVEQGLKEAENYFRSYDYHQALEQAATSIEEVEPGALKRIEIMLDDQ